SGLSWKLTRPVFRLAGIIAGFDLESHRPIDRMSEITVPYLALQGTRDNLVSESSARDLAGAAGGSNVAYIYYDGPHDEPDNDEAAKHIEAFVQERLRALGTPREG